LQILAGEVGGLRGESGHPTATMASLISWGPLLVGAVGFILSFVPLMQGTSAMNDEMLSLSLASVNFDESITVLTIATLPLLLSLLLDVLDGTFVVKKQLVAFTSRLILGVSFLVMTRYMDGRAGVGMSIATFVCLQTAMKIVIASTLLACLSAVATKDSSAAQEPVSAMWGPIKTTGLTVVMVATHLLRLQTYFTLQQSLRTLSIVLLIINILFAVGVVAPWIPPWLRWLVSTVNTPKAWTPKPQHISSFIYFFGAMAAYYGIPAVLAQVH
jgi:hypothetical protein